MFVRFKNSPRRLDVSLIEAVRRDGKPRQIHVASLGSIAQPPSVADRVAFWAKLHARLAKLGNRLDAEAHGKILGAVHARIPMTSADEQRAVQLENAQAEAEVYGAVAGWYGSSAQDSERLLASAEQTIAAHKGAAESAADIAKAAQEKAARLARGENVAGGLGKPADIVAILQGLGFKKADMRRTLRTAGLSPEEFEAVLAEKLRRQKAVADWMPRDGQALAELVAAHRARQAKSG